MAVPRILIGRHPTWADLPTAHDWFICMICHAQKTFAPVLVCSLILGCGNVVVGSSSSQTSSTTASGGSSESTTATGGMSTSSSGASGGSGGSGGSTPFCQPGEAITCYTAAPLTMGVGICKSGVQTCLPGGDAFGPCEGEVTPIAEVCFNGLDDNCNTLTDEMPDKDGDGYTICDNDCDDSDPMVNPGAYEVTFQVVNNNCPYPNILPGVGNGKDDDCNPATPDVGIPPDCPSSSKKSAVTPLDLAAAFDLCLVAPENPPQAQKTPGIVAAQFRLADGTVPSEPTLNAMQNAQTAVLEYYGIHSPLVGPTFAGLSTGAMRDETDPTFLPTNPGTAYGSLTSAPVEYLAANGGVLPPPWAPPASTAYDSVLLRLAIRMPTNVNTFRYSFRFFTAEYQLPNCGQNDFFLALFNGQWAFLPPDKNIAVDNTFNPISAQSCFFPSCVTPSCTSCPAGASALTSTGMFSAIEWQTVDVGVIPGELVNFDLTIFDVENAEVDSAVLLDGFEWSWRDGCIGPPNL
ncbi:MAG: putative metal-binding motif-containing protein [Polyangiaceae bacterium]|nr:putative metal-binding motif-containing protein [Polyangiaceae bacterium]